MATLTRLSAPTPTMGRLVTAMAITSSAQPIVAAWVGSTAGMEDTVEDTVAGMVEDTIEDLEVEGSIIGGEGDLKIMVEEALAGTEVTEVTEDMEDTIDYIVMIVKLLSFWPRNQFFLVFY